jgi:predicted outer membrane lipoprotein
MTKRIIGSTLVLCAAAVITAWGLEHARSAFTGNAKDGDRQNTPANDAGEPVG